MLSFASAASREDKAPVGTFRSSRREPAVVVPEYVAWLRSLPGKPVLDRRRRRRQRSGPERGTMAVG